MKMNCLRKIIQKIFFGSRLIDSVYSFYKKFLCSSCKDHIEAKNEYYYQIVIISVCFTRFN